MARFLTLLNNPRRWAAFTAAVALLGIFWIRQSAVLAAVTTGGPVPSPREGFPAPDFTLPTLDGDDVTLSTLRGQAVIINLWTSRCPTCG